MGTETRVEIVSTPVLGPNQRMVHGRIVGPVDEQYPPGTGGPLPRAVNLRYQTVVVTTVRDTNSGHTQSRQTSVEQFDTGEFTDEELSAFNRAVMKARVVPGKKFLVGRPTLVDAAPTPVTGPGAVVHSAAEPITPEVQLQMDAHYWKLDGKSKTLFLAEYPDYTPGPQPDVSHVSETVEHEEETTKEEPAAETTQAANAKRVAIDRAKVGK